MPMFDYQCEACGRVAEVFFPMNQREDRISCDCLGAMSIVWLKAPGIAPDITPYFDIQLGCQINTKKQREEIVKAKGKVMLGPDELRRTDSQLHAERPNAEVEAGKLREAMKKAWSDVRNGNVPKTEVPTTPSDAIIVSSDGGSTPTAVS